MNLFDCKGLDIYGNDFSGFDSIEKLRPQLPAFKEFYILEKRKNPAATLFDLLRRFHAKEVAEGRSFMAHPSTLTARVKVWKADALNFIYQKNMEIPITPKIIQKGENHLEERMETLADVLLDDAHDVLDDNSADDGVQDMIARKKYAATVLGTVTKLVHGKRSLELKTSEERRNNTSFLLDYLKKATAGKVTNEEMNLLNPNQDAELITPPTGT